MMRCKQLFSVLALVAPVAVVIVASPLASSSALAEERYPNLCENTDGVCVVGPMDEAVDFDDDVCWDSDRIRLMGAEGCTGNSRAFHLSYGYVIDPIANTVFAYSPVMDTCDAGFCVTGELDPGALLKEGLACCNDDGVCTPPAEGTAICTKDKPTWCTQLEENDNGTVTCHA